MKKTKRGWTSGFPQHDKNYFRGGKLTTKDKIPTTLQDVEDAEYIRELEKELTGKVR